MYKSFFIGSSKRVINPVLIKIHTVYLTMTNTMPAKFKLNQIVYLDAIVFTQICRYASL